MGGAAIVIRLVDVMIHVALMLFFINDILSVEEYFDIFYNVTEIRNYVKTLPVISVECTSAKFKVEELPMIAFVNIDNHPTLISATEVT